MMIPFGESAVENLSPTHTFTTDQIEKFQKRIDNGYNLFVEKDIVAWLRLYNPKQKFTKVCYKVQESLCNPSQIDNILCMLCFRNYTDDLVVLVMFLMKNITHQAVNQ